LTHTVCGMIQAEQVESSDNGVADKLSKLSVKESPAEADGKRESVSDHPGSKRTKGGSRSRRRRKGRRGGDSGTAAVSEGMTVCEFVRGGGGKMHSSSGPRRDWFTTDTTNKHGDTRSAAPNDRHKEHQDNIDRRKTVSVPGPAVDRSAVGLGKEPRRQRSSKLHDAGLTADGRKSLSTTSKELSGSKRQGAGQKQTTPASASVSESQVGKPKTPAESGQFVMCIFRFM